MFARHPKGQERDGWIWRPHGAMNGMRTASRDFTEFVAEIITKHLEFKHGKLERCLFVHESNETRVVIPRGRSSHSCQTDTCKILRSQNWWWSRGEALNPRVHIMHTVLRWSISLDLWMLRTGDCPVESQKCMLLVHCQLSWFSHKLFWKRLDYHSWHTWEQTAAQHAQWQRNREQVVRWNTFTRVSYSFKIWYFGNF